MMKRITTALLVAAAMLCVLSIHISAYDAESSPIGEVSEYLPDELTDSLPDPLKGVTTPEAVIGALDFRSTAKWLCEIALECLRGVLSPFCRILAVVVIGTVFGALKSGISSDALSQAVGYAVSLCTALTVYDAIGALWEQSAVQLERLTVLMNSMLPVMTTLYAAGGNVTSAAVSNASLTAVMALLENILASGLYPILQLCFVLSVMGCISGCIDLGGVADFVRNTYTTVLVFIMMLLSTTMAYQNKLASAADSTAARTIKFAAGNLIPVVGGAVGEAVRMIGGSLELIKSTVGILGVIAIAAVVLPLVISLIINKSALNFISVISRTLGCDAESRIIASAAGMINLTLALVASASVIFVYALALFIKTAAAIS